MSKLLETPIPAGGGEGKFLCLTICGYKKAGMREEDYRHHMTQVSAPMTKDLMVKYGIVRWTQVSDEAISIRACTSHSAYSRSIDSQPIGHSRHDEPTLRSPNG